jgi:NodT family efflux transporter outer membrane factor (OMF) lipoprotein
MALSGCALDTRIPKPDIHLPAAYEAGSAQGPAAPADTLDRWWLQFDDPQLTGLVEQALVASPDAKSALGRLREANATLRETIVGLLPQGDFKANASAEHISDRYSNISPSLGQFLSEFSGAGNDQVYSGGLNATWQLDVFGRDLMTINAASDDFAAQRFDYEATRMGLAASVATDLFQARGLAIQLADARENSRLAHEIASVSDKKAAAGLGTSADAARLESDAIALDAQVAQTDALLKGAIRSLLVLVGRGADPSATLPIEAIARPAPAVPATAPGALLARRPDVREAELNVRLAAAELRLDKTALLPTFTLQPSYQYLRQVQPGFTTETITGAAGVGVTVPVLSLPKLLEEIRAQGARGEQAVAAYEKALQTAYGDAENGLATLQADEARVGLLKTATDKSRFAYDAARKGYDLGLTDTTSLVQAEQEWRQTRSTYTAAATSALLDAVTTFKALGGGWPYTSQGSKRGGAPRQSAPAPAAPGPATSGSAASGSAASGSATSGQTAAGPTAAGQTAPGQSAPGQTALGRDGNTR